MRRRYLYVVMFAVPALLAATIASGLVAAVLLTIFWVFVFGDNTWPTAAWATLAVAAAGSFLGLCGFLLWLAYSTGRDEEARPALNPAHAALSAGATGLLVVLAILVRNYFYSS